MERWIESTIYRIESVPFGIVTLDEMEWWERWIESTICVLMLNVRSGSRMVSEW